MLLWGLENSSEFSRLIYCGPSTLQNAPGVQIIKEFVLQNTPMPTAVKTLHCTAALKLITEREFSLHSQQSFPWSLQHWELQTQCSVPKETRLRYTSSFPTWHQSDKDISICHCAKINHKGEKIGLVISHLKKVCMHGLWLAFFFFPLLGWEDGKIEQIVVFKSLKQ